jgi:hypothetical protein
MLKRTARMKVGSMDDMMMAGRTVTWREEGREGQRGGGETEKARRGRLTKKQTKTRYCIDADDALRLRNVRPTTRAMLMWLKRRVKT